jgi:hypothetical protein
MIVKKYMDGGIRLSSRETQALTILQELATAIEGGVTDFVDILKGSHLARRATITAPNEAEIGGFHFFRRTRDAGQWYVLSVPHGHVTTFGTRLRQRSVLLSAGGLALATIDRTFFASGPLDEDIYAVTVRRFNMSERCWNLEKPIYLPAKYGMRTWRFLHDSPDETETYDIMRDDSDLQGGLDSWFWRR